MSIYPLRWNSYSSLPHSTFFLNNARPSGLLSNYWFEKLILNLKVGQLFLWCRYSSSLHNLSTPTAVIATVPGIVLQCSYNSKCFDVRGFILFTSVAVAFTWHSAGTQYLVNTWRMDAWWTMASSSVSTLSYFSDFYFFFPLCPLPGYLVRKI